MFVKHINNFLFSINSIALIFLLLSDLSIYISPAKFWIMEFFGLAYFYILIINVIFLIYWLILKKKRALICLLILLANYPILKNYLQIDLLKSKNPIPHSSFKIMSFNVKLFDLYNWTKNLETNDKIFSFIKEESPDIICIQEFFNSKRIGLNNLDIIVKSQKAKNFHIEYTENLRDTDQWGIATFSIYPIINKGKILFNETTNNICIYTDIVKDEDTIRIYNVHFQSNRFHKEDYEFLENVNIKNDEQKFAASKNIIKRLKIGAIKRSKQVDMVAEYISRSPHPIIICGDFNDPPSTYAYYKIRKNLKDAFVESGNGIGNTYNGILPSFRIDYILYDKQFKSYLYETIEEDLSDHYPISCLLVKEEY